MKKRICIIFIFVYACTDVYAQLRKSDLWRNQYARQENYIPNEETPVLTLHINLNFWQKKDGSGNWQDNAEHRNRLEQIVKWTNNLYEFVCVPSDSIEGVPSLRDSKVRLKLEGIYFYRDSALHLANTEHGDKLNKHLAQYYPERLHAMNIHVTGGGSFNNRAFGQASGTTFRDADHWIVTLNNEAEETGDYAWAAHLAHELGHNFMLAHPYNSEYLRKSHPDFLYDVFVPSTQVNCVPSGGNDVCYHYTHWACDTRDPNNSCTNNIMGGTRDACYISPLQMGRMHRAIQVYNFGKYFTGYSPYVHRISQNEIWDFDYRSFRDIQIAPQCTLRIDGKLYMMEGTAIYLQKNAVLEVRGEILAGGREFPGHNGKWRGIIRTGKKKNRGQVIYTGLDTK